MKVFFGNVDLKGVWFCFGRRKGFFDGDSEKRIEN
jgi:hypothetical protein